MRHIKFTHAFKSLNVGSKKNLASTKHLNENGIFGNSKLKRETKT